MKKLLYITILFPIIGLSQELITNNIFYDGHNREYTIYIPQTYSSLNSEPILFAFHGGSGYSDDFMNYEADLRPNADTAGFILVYPQALEDPNDGNSTNWLHKDPTDHKDIFFIETLIDTIASNYNVDFSRIYACGYSLGGMFAYELACQLNNRITSIVSVAGAAFYGAFAYCELTHPTSVMSISGTNDLDHPYNDTNGWYFPVAEINNFWSTSNNTDPSPLVEELPNIDPSDGSSVERYSWINGDGCVSVEELKIINGGHDWPSPLSPWSNQDINANSEIWNFVSKYNMDGLIGCDDLSVKVKDIADERELLKIINVVGQEVNSTMNKGEILFYIYRDGTVQKKINF
tara:strand:+ start:1390 stop:2433 length:1044 start_codon:yes stop_codon:yes gene_type:complete